MDNHYAAGTVVLLLVIIIVVLNMILGAGRGKGGHL